MWGRYTEQGDRKTVSARVSIFRWNCGNTVRTVRDISCNDLREGKHLMTNDWPAIVNCHTALVVGSVRRIVGNNHDAEDVVQDVFLEAYRTSQKTEIRNWPGFLRRVAARRAIDRLRMRCTRPLVMLTTEAVEVADSSPQPHLNAAACELAERLRHAITLLPRRQAEVFSMRCFEEMTYEQIADALGMSSNAVGTALHKARSRLQALLAEKITAGNSS
jgi:RNA polymerase sigma-70 factor (ECF subfamily)